MGRLREPRNVARIRQLEEGAGVDLNQVGRVALDKDLVLAPVARDRTIAAKERMALADEMIK
jgi:hypothetical protein